MALLTPSLSITSTDSLRPAVSLNSTGYPDIFTADSTMSRVVPATSETIAAGRWASKHKYHRYYCRLPF